MSKYVSVVTAGCGLVVVSLLLFAGCTDPGGGGSSGGGGNSDSGEDGQLGTSGTVATETLDDEGPVTVTIPTHDPPPRSSMSVYVEDCGIPGATCYHEEPTSDSSEPSEIETSDIETVESTG